MKIHYVTRPYLSIFVWILTPLILSLPAKAQLQTFEFSYGSGTCAEKGFKGVEPVNLQTGACPNGGYIAVGYTSEKPNGSCGPDDDVYVVLTNANGTRIGEFVYDIGGLGGFDHGMVVRELSNGFIIAGTTTPQPGATSDVFLLRIDCNGTPMFTQTYDFNNGANDHVSDLIVATVGTPGDFVLAGWSERAWPNMSDGLLMRTNSAGGVLWHKTYNIPATDPDQHDDYFNTLVEEQTLGTGDIIAAGYTTSFSFDGPNFFGTQGLVVRVNGNSGSIGLPPQGVAHYGGSQNERFDAVTELTSNLEWGNLVFAGSTTALGVEDIYLVKTASNPCLMLAQNTVNHVTGSGEIALGIVESWTPGMPFCPIGELAIVGRTTLDCPNPGPTVPSRHDDALLLHVIPSTLTAVAGKHFGSQMGCVRNDVFYSVKDVSQTDPGFIMCGSTADNPAPVAPPPPIPDPSNLYLVKTDGNGETGCEEEWNFIQQDPEWEVACRNALTASTRSVGTVLTLKTNRDHQEEVCDSDDDLMDDLPPANGSSLGGLQEREFNVWDAGSLLSPTSVKKESNSDKNSVETGTIQARGNR